MPFVMFLRSALHNYPLLAAVVGWLSAQVIKTILNFLISGKINMERMFGSGGMPSAHSSCVCALTLATARNDGIDSTMFAISVILATVVMYDAMGVRLQAGKQAKTLKKVVSALEKEKDDEESADFSAEDRELKDSLGHKPLEVLGGALLGILVAMLIPG